MLTLTLPSLIISNLAAASASASVKELGRFSLPSKFKFEGKRFGGISALALIGSPAVGLKSDLGSKQTNAGLGAIRYWSVCDDRGKYGEPRLYELELKLKKTEPLEFEIKILSQILVNQDQVSETTGHGNSQTSALKKKKSTMISKRILDLEAMAPLPWGGWLLASEGDLGKKPRQLPRLLEVNAEGELQKDHSLPTAFLPELTGQQTKGIKNNQGIEGLTRLSEIEILAAVEGPLMNQTGFVPFLILDTSKAWTVNSTVSLKYPLEPQVNPIGQTGVSEVHSLGDDRILVLERELSIGAKGLLYYNRLFEAKLPLRKEGEQIGNKKLIWEATGTGLNLEAIAEGPTINGRRTLLLVSDNNFSNDVPTEFVLIDLPNQ